MCFERESLPVPLMCKQAVITAFNLPIVHAGTHLCHGRNDYAAAIRCGPKPHQIGQVLHLVAWAVFHKLAFFNTRIFPAVDTFPVIEGVSKGYNAACDINIAVLL